MMARAAWVQLSSARWGMLHDCPPTVPATCVLDIQLVLPLEWWIHRATGCCKVHLLTQRYATTRCNTLRSCHSIGIETAARCQRGYMVRCDVFAHASLDSLIGGVETGLATGNPAPVPPALCIELPRLLNMRLLPTTLVCRCWCQSGSCNAQEREKSAFDEATTTPKTTAPLLTSVQRVTRMPFASVCHLCRLGSVWGTQIAAVYFL